MSNRSMARPVRLLSSLSRTHHLPMITKTRTFTSTPTSRRKDFTTNPAAVHIPRLATRDLRPRRRSASPVVPTNPTAELAYPHVDQSSVVPNPEELEEQGDEYFNSGSPSASVEETTFFRITLRRSAIGLPGTTAQLLASMGLHRRGMIAYHPVTPSTVGKLMRIKELVALEEIPFSRLPPGADEIVRLTHFTDAARPRGVPKLSKEELKTHIAEIMTRYLGAPKFPGGMSARMLDETTDEVVDVWVADRQARDRHAPPVLGPARLIAKLEGAQRMRERMDDVGFWVERRAGQTLEV